MDFLPKNLIYGQHCSDENNIIEETSTEDNTLFWAVIFASIIIMIALISLFELSYKQRKILNFYVKKGKEKINEIDLFINEYNDKD